MTQRARPTRRLRGGCRQRLTGEGGCSGCVRAIPLSSSESAAHQRPGSPARPCPRPLRGVSCLRGLAVLDVVAGPRPGTILRSGSASISAAPPCHAAHPVDDHPRPWGMVLFTKLFALAGLPLGCPVPPRGAFVHARRICRLAPPAVLPGCCAAAGCWKSSPSAGTWPGSWCWPSSR